MRKDRHNRTETSRDKRRQAPLRPRKQKDSIRWGGEGVEDYPGPASCAGLGIQGQVLAIHGHHTEGGLRPELAAPPNDRALMHRELVKRDRGAEVDTRLEAVRKYVAVVVPPRLRPGGKSLQYMRGRGSQE